MKSKLMVAARILLGLVYFVFGLNGFLKFIPMPEQMPEGVMKLMTAFVESGYMMPFVKGTEVIGGLLLLVGFFVPMALTILAPITLNILAFHVFLTPPSEWIMSIVMVVIHGYLFWCYKPAFEGLLKK